MRFAEQWDWRLRIRSMTRALVSELDRTTCHLDGLGVRSARDRPGNSACERHYSDERGV